MSAQQIFFSGLLVLVGYLAYRLYGRIWRNIHLGKEYVPDGEKRKRWSNLLLVAFGQRKMFKQFLPAIFHFFIYVAFLLTQIELIEIIADGISGNHRLFAAPLGRFYPVLISTIEILSVLALIATLIFLWRRNVRKVARFEKPEMTGWPKQDANLILMGEIFLILAIMVMNGADTVLQDMNAAHYPDTGFLAISGILGPALFDNLDVRSLVWLERAGWWMHVLVVFGFLLYLPVSKHLHILLAFPNVYYARQRAAGSMTNMPEIMREVQSMLGLEGEEPAGNSSEEIAHFGAGDVFDLTWKNLLDAYACTECGRCTAVCPANITGKKLSPRKIMMDVRDRAEEVGRRMESGDQQYIRDDQRQGEKQLSKHNYADDKSLFSYITPEELHACTTCNACVEACPVMINPLEIILEMRRYEILTLASGPQDWIPMFNSLENSGSVWQVTADRDAWTKK